MATTYNNLYLDVRRRLREAGVEGAQLRPGSWCALPPERTGSSITGIWPSMLLTRWRRS